MGSSIRRKEMSAALEYEWFLRTAFGLTDGCAIDRGADPAGLADYDVFDQDNVDTIKAAVCYSMEAFAGHIPGGEDLSEEEWGHIARFVPRVIGAPSVAEVVDLIREFWDTVVERFYAPTSRTWMRRM
jgi:hypothetical protein